MRRVQRYRAHTGVRGCLFNAQRWWGHALKMLSPARATPSLVRYCSSSHLFLFPADSPASLLRPLSLSASVSSQHIFLPQLSSLISFSFLNPPPNHHDHLCSCIKVSQSFPASSKLTFPPFKSRSSPVESRKIKRHLPFYIYLFIYLK